MDLVQTFYTYVETAASLKACSAADVSVRCLSQQHGAKFPGCCRAALPAGRQGHAFVDNGGMLLRAQCTHLCVSQVLRAHSGTWWVRPKRIFVTIEHVSAVPVCSAHDGNLSLSSHKRCFSF
jgi:hypothetical protein